jgi:hypothetical protein
LSSMSFGRRVAVIASQRRLAMSGEVIQAA